MATDTRFRRRPIVPDSQLSAELFEFLRELRKNNNREWFLANKAYYESVVRDPLLRFIAEVGPRLRTISRHSEPPRCSGSIATFGSRGTRARTKPPPKPTSLTPPATRPGTPPGSP